MRDALKFGRLLGEAAARTLHDPAKLDAALRDWEASRDADTISTYHWGNRESRPGATSPLVHEVLRTFAGDDRPNLSDTFNRARPVETVINPARLVTGLIRALRAPGADRRAIFKELRTELPMEISIRRHRLLDGFRSTRPTATERDGWSVGRAPKPPSYRPAAEQEHLVSLPAPDGSATNGVTPDQGEAPDDRYDSGRGYFRGADEGAGAAG